jgi:ABC-type dipeptide/oligopeptide/nickel transport system permease subunit
MSSRLLKGLSVPVLIVASLVVISFLIPVMYPDFDKIMNYLKDDEGRLIAAPPFSPSEMAPLGSDRLGRNFFLLLLAGAKYTIFAALFIAFLRIVLGFIFAVIYTFVPAFTGRYIKGLGESFQYIPLAIIVFAILVPLESSFQPGFLPSNEYFVIQLCVIALITAPSLGIYLGEEMKLYLNQEFIQVSRTMGAGRFNIMKIHLLPQFLRHSIVLFSEQVTQALSLLIQLGIMLMALGGLKIAEFAFSALDPSNPVYFSKTNEWGATIGMNIQLIFSNPLLVLVPLAFFAVIILCMNSITSQLRRIFIENDKPFTKVKKVKTEREKSEAGVSKDLFTLKQ